MIITRSAEEVEPPPAMLRATSSIGQECLACQIRLGAAPTRAIAAASQGPGRRSTSRGPATSTPNRQLTSTRASSTFTSSAIPAARPTHSQARSEAGRPIARIRSSSTQVVSARSKVEIENRCATAIGNELLATIKAVTTCARRDAPISRAVKEASRIVATPASAGSTRKRVRLPPTSPCQPAASSGTRIGLSGCAQAGWCPPSMKYNSSRWNPYRWATSIHSPNETAAMINTPRGKGPRTPVLPRLETPTARTLRTDPTLAPPIEGCLW